LWGGAHMIGSTVENYRITAKLGAGGMGQVYRALDLELERDVAIKCLRPELVENDDIAERFRVEARTLAKLKHPNIATVYRFFARGEQLYLVLELIDGQNFEELIRSEGRIAPARAAGLLRQAAAGLVCAHQAGVIHRDIKPANLMLASSGLVKITDFGIAHVLGGTRLTRSGTVVGTLEYMAPERIRGGDAVDARTDVYSLCAVAYEMLTGQVPFRADSDFELMRAQMEDEPAAPRKLVPEIPEALEDAVLRGLEKKPEDRHDSAAAFSHALAEAARVRPRRQRGKNIAVAALLIGGIAASVAVLARNDGLGSIEDLASAVSSAGDTPDVALQPAEPQDPEPLDADTGHADAEEPSNDTADPEYVVEDPDPTESAADPAQPGISLFEKLTNGRKPTEDVSARPPTEDVAAAPPLAKRIQRQLSFNAIEGVDVRLDGEAVVTEGFVSSARDQARVRDVVRAIAPGREHRDLTIVR